MKTNKSAVQETATTHLADAIASHPSILVPISPELLECIKLLQSVNDKLHDWSKKFPQVVDNYLPLGGVGDMVMSIDNLIGDISDVMRWQMVENICINKISA